MESLVQLLDGIEYGEKESKLSYLNLLNDAVEFQQFNGEDLSYAAEKLISLALYESEASVKSEIFRCLENILLDPSSLDIDLSELIHAMPADQVIAANTLLLLALSARPTYIPLVKSYVNHSEELIRKNAHYALKHLEKI
ncbi:MAG: hypothetical protein R2772_02740 [Chitinophagales bacterium]